jgi:hypothetical protein
MKYVIFTFLLLFNVIALAATTWTQDTTVDYYKYQTTPSTQLTNHKYVHIKTTEDKEIPASWTKIGSIWRKEISTGGAVRYVEFKTTTPPVVDNCAAEVVCHRDWGWIVNLEALKTLNCAAVKITKEQIVQLYSNAVASSDACPVYPK